MVSPLPPQEDDANPAAQPEDPTPQTERANPSPQAEPAGEAPQSDREDAGLNVESDGAEPRAEADSVTPAGNAESDAALAATIPPAQPLPPVESDPAGTTRVSAPRQFPPAFDERNFPPDADATPPSARATRPSRPEPPPFLYPTDPAALPHRVDETDLDATRVTPAAYQQAPPRANQAQA